MKQVPLLLLALLIPSVASSQRMEIAGLTRGITYTELWQALGDSSLWNPPYEPYDLKDDYFVYPASNSPLGLIHIEFVTVYMRKGRVEAVTMQRKYEGRVGVDSLRAYARPVWNQVHTWAHGGIGTRELESVPTTGSIYALDRGEGITLGRWTRGEDQLGVSITAGKDGRYYLGADLRRKAR